MRIAMILVLSLSAACGGTREDSTLPAGGGAAPADAEPGSLDGAVPCAREIALQCAEGLIDGCLRELTTVHACVPEDAAAGPPCEQELALVCPEGMIDACLVTPAAADHHVCIVK